MPKKPLEMPDLSHLDDESPLAPAELTDEELALIAATNDE